MFFALIIILQNRKSFSLVTFKLLTTEVEKVHKIHHPCLACTLCVSAQGCKPQQTYDLCCVAQNTCIISVTLRHCVFPPRKCTKTLSSVPFAPQSIVDIASFATSPVCRNGFSHASSILAPRRSSSNSTHSYHWHSSHSVRSVHSSHCHCPRWATAWVSVLVTVWVSAYTFCARHSRSFPAFHPFKGSCCSILQCC